jgi:hypothetical protein
MYFCNRLLNKIVQKPEEIVSFISWPLNNKFKAGKKLLLFFAKIHFNEHKLSYTKVFPKHV